MARTVIVHITDDFDKRMTADEEIHLGIDGTTYVLDLTAEHAEELRADVRRWLEAAHESYKTPPRPAPRKTTNKSITKTPPASTPQRDRRDPLLVKMRVWGRDNGFDVSDRGVVPKALQQAYKVAQRRAARSKPAAKKKTPQGRAGARTAKQNAIADSAERRRIRSWARQAHLDGTLDIAVGDRGILPAAAVAAYYTHHNNQEEAC